jgi:hypothetical protein
VLKVFRNEQLTRNIIARYERLLANATRARGAGGIGGHTIRLGDTTRRLLEHCRLVGNVHSVNFEATFDLPDNRKQQQQQQRRVPRIVGVAQRLINVLDTELVKIRCNGELQRPSSGVWGAFASMFGGDEPKSNQGQLTAIVKMLRNIFKIAEQPLSPAQIEQRRRQLNSHTRATESPQRIDGTSVLTHRAREDIRLGRRICSARHLRYEGPARLQPCATHEFESLVHLALWLNAVARQRFDVDINFRPMASSRTLAQALLIAAIGAFMLFAFFALVFL